MENLTQQEFEQLPLVAEGHSKIIRYAGEGDVITKLKPTVYSYTHNRAGEIEGTDKIRMRASKALLSVVRGSVHHAYKDFSTDYVLSKLVMQESTGELCQPFMPTDLSQREIDDLPRATPIETVVKKYHTGTPKHRYFGMNGTKARDGSFSGTGMKIETDKRYPSIITRFDWRNPLENNQGQRLADEVLPEEMANWYIDVDRAKTTARLAFCALDRHMTKVGLDLWDICFFITENGKMIFSEISPDCMRVRSNESSLDKDVWRRGGSSDAVLEKWTEFAEKVEHEL